MAARYIVGGHHRADGESFRDAGPEFWDQLNRLAENHEVEGVYNEDGIGVPIQADGKVLGAIFVRSYTKDIHYTDRDDEVLASVAQYIATALTRLRALEAEHQRNNELAIINRVQEALASKLNLQAIYELIGEKVREVLKVKVADIITYDPTTNLINMPYSYEKGDLSKASYR